jgi:hypothetical protein
MFWLLTVTCFRNSCVIVALPKYINKRQRVLEKKIAIMLDVNKTLILRLAYKVDSFTKRKLCLSKNQDNRFKPNAVFLFPLTLIPVNIFCIIFFLRIVFLIWLVIERHCFLQLSAEIPKSLIFLSCSCYKFGFYNML